MSMTPAKAFVDTNILLRAFVVEMDQHARAEALLKEYWQQGTELWISGQVIREYLVQITHPKTFKEPLPIDTVIESIKRITPLFQIADDTPAVRNELLELLKKYPTRGKQIHDANIVAAMLAHGIEVLLTLNVEDMKRFSDRITLITLD